MRAGAQDAAAAPVDATGVHGGSVGENQRRARTRAAGKSGRQDVSEQRPTLLPGAEGFRDACEEFARVLEAEGFWRVPAYLCGLLERALRWMGRRKAARDEP